MARPRSDRFWRSSAIVVVTCMLASACAPGVDDDEDAAPSGNASPEAGEAEQSGGQLRWAMAGDPTTLHPHQYGAQNDRQILAQIYDTMLVHDRETYEVEPSIITEWSVAEDGLSYTLTVREGVTFHDGRALTAEDVRWSIEQSMVEEASRTASLLTAIESIDIEGDDVVLNLNAPDRYIPQALVDVYVSPDDEDIDYNDAPIGTGPFQFVEWQRNQRVVLEAFDDYWQEGLPYLDGVVIESVPEDSTRVSRLLNDEVDLVEVVPFAQYEALDAAGIELVTPPGGLSTGYYDLRLNTREEPWSDPAVRQALSYAIDREAIAQALLGFMTPTANPVFESLDEYFDPDAPTYEHDPDRARQLLSSAGHDGGVEGGTLFVHPDLGIEYSIVAELIQDQAATVGIDIELENMDVATWVERVFNENEFDVGLSSMIPKPDEYDLIAHTWSKITGQATGWAEQSPEFFDLLAEARTFEDEAYVEAIRDLQELAMEGQSVIVVGGRNASIALQPRVRDFVAHAQTTVFLRDVWLGDD